MEAFAIIALIGFALLVAELLLSTGGVLAMLGVAGLIAGGVLALNSDNHDAADYFGPALITLGVLSGVCFYFVTRKVIAAHRDQPVRTGTEEMVGATGEARTAIAPEGQVFMQGTLWSARLADAGSPVGLGDKVRVEAVDGLTLVVRPQPAPAKAPKEGVG
jgi:membrane-bound serine protease (ClpP class)